MCGIILQNQCGYRYAAGSYSICLCHFYQHHHRADGKYKNESKPAWHFGGYCFNALPHHMAFTQELNFGVWLAIVVVLTGVVCTARFIVSDHTPQEIYGGLITGALSMLIARLVGPYLM